MAIEVLRLDSLAAGMHPVTGGNEHLGFRVQRLADGQRSGVDMVTLHCGGRQVTVLPTRGMGIWQAEYRETRFGWDSSVPGPVHPMWVPLDAPDGLGWLAGFDEMLVRCGLASNGAPDFDESGRLVCPLHGRIANLPARDVTIEIDPDEGLIAIRGIVEESRFHFRRLHLESMITLREDSADIEIVDRVTNESARPGQVQLLYHANFGPPILENGTRFMAPVRRLVPRDVHAAKNIAAWDVYAAPDPGFQEEVYFMELAADEAGRSVVLLTNADQSQGVSIDFDTSTLPCFTLWKNTVGLEDGYVTGLEPGTNFPNSHHFEAQRGRIIALAPQESVSFSVRIGLHTTGDSLTPILQRIERLTPPASRIIQQPDDDWAPAG